MNAAPVNVILGGAGMVGRALGRRLRAAGETVASYDLAAGWDLRHHEPPAPAGGAFYWFLAWDSGGARYLHDPSAQGQQIEHNVELCQRVFGWLRDRRAPFLFTGSQMAGYPTAYGVTKALGHHWTRCLGGQLAVLWNVYGPGPVSPRSHLVEDVIGQALGSGEIRLLTDGAERRQFLHVDDCVEALVRQRNLGRPEAHVASGDWITVREVARIVADLTAATLRLGPRPGYESPVQPTQPVPGWSPKISLEEGLRRTVAAMHDAGTNGAGDSP